MIPENFRVDARGRAHERVSGSPRIISLVPSITELLIELGLAKQLVGRTGFCIHPRDVVKELPKVGGTKDVDIKKVRALKPTHVILNIDENRREIVEPLEEFVEHIFVTHPLAPIDNLELFEALGFLFKVEQRAFELGQAFRREMEAFSSGRSRNVLYLIWRDPWMTISRDTYISRMLALVNWTTLPSRCSERYPAIKLEDFVGEVDKVLLSSEPYPFRGRHIEEVQDLFGIATEVKLVDGEMLSWYGSRAIAGLRYLNDLATIEASTAAA